MKAQPGLTLLFLLLTILLLQGCASKDLTTIHDDAYEAYHNHDYELAVQKFEILVQEVPRDAELWFRLGNAYSRSNRQQQAVLAYQNALVRDPQLSKAWFNMGLIQIRTALKSFMEMETYLKEDDPIRIQGGIMRDGLFELLGQDNDAKSK